MITSAVVNTTPAWVSLCGTMAPMASIALCMAPMPTIRQISKTKSVGNLPMLPQTSLLTNCFLWVTYGILKQEPSVVVANGVGLVLSSYYFWEFVKYAPKSSPTLPGAKAQQVKAVFTSMIMASSIALLLPTQKAAKIIGNTAVVLCMILFASPLVAMKTVLQEKSAESIPLPFTMATVVNCFLWSVVGLKQMKDFVIYFPNLVGLSFGLMQVALKLIYGGKGSSAAEIAM